MPEIKVDDIAHVRFAATDLANPTCNYYCDIVSTAIADTVS